MILAERAARVEAEALAARAQAAAANARADLSSTEALISHYKLEIEKLRRQLYGTRSERRALRVRGSLSHSTDFRRGRRRPRHLAFLRSCAG
jgi:hypothetical protein